jgi:hypothetical protein
MSNVKYECVDQLDTAFRASRNSYYSLVKKVTNWNFDKTLYKYGKEKVLIQIPNINYRMLPNLPPTKALIEIKNGFRVQFTKEIMFNWVNGNINYFKVLNKIMANYYEFIKVYCPTGLDLFFSNQVFARDCHARLIAKDSILSKQELIIAIQFDFISLFNWFEEIIIDAYDEYQKKLVKVENKLPSIVADPISLRYGENNDKIIELVHTTIGKYINEDLMSFRKHFYLSDSPLTAIKWYAKQSVLCTLFYSKPLKLNTDFNIKGLDIKNEELGMLMQHFSKSTGEPFNVEKELPKPLKNLSQRSLK